MSSLYICGNNPLSDILLSNIFSYSVGGLFVLLIVSVIVQKLFGLMWSYLFILLFFPLPEETYQKKILLRLMSKRILPMISLNSFMVSGLTCKSLIHFKFI